MVCFAEGDPRFIYNPSVRRRRWSERDGKIVSYKEKMHQHRADTPADRAWGMKKIKRMKQSRMKRAGRGFCHYFAVRGGGPLRGFPRRGHYWRRFPSILSKYLPGSRFATRPAVFLAFKFVYSEISLVTKFPNVNQEFYYSAANSTEKPAPTVEAMVFLM